MIAGILVAVIALVALAYVTAPIRKGAQREPDETDAPARDAEGRKNAALTAIIDIEDERDVGKLSQEDFAALRMEYEAQALTALRELDAVEGFTNPEDDLEAEIAAVRATLECPSCGALRGSHSTCPQCGT